MCMMWTIEIVYDNFVAQQIRKILYKEEKTTKIWKKKLQKMCRYPNSSKDAVVLPKNCSMHLQRAIIVASKLLPIKFPHCLRAIQLCPCNSIE